MDDGWMDRWMRGWVGARTDGRTDGRMDPTSFFVTDCCDIEFKLHNYTSVMLSSDD